MEESTDSKTTSRIIRQWYQACINHHLNCLKPGVGRLPTRLLHLEKDSLRLCHSSEIPCGTQYATLSHCWGGLESLKLLKSNYKEFILDIPRDQLSKNFTDAIQITKSLNLSYLWIDSLCIVQDDPEDWRHEAVLMSEVYGHSSINIAAADAENGKIGCFFQRNPRDIRPLRIKLVKQSSLGDYVIFDLYAQTERIQSGALIKRAWAFQERFLSPRTLHFTCSQVFWECNRQIASEVFPTGFVGFPYHSEVSLGRDWKLEELWPHIVRLYSMGKLTYGTDKLIALSGVAKWYQDQRDDQYLAGLWKNDLARGLLWWVTNFKEDNQPAEYQAPSWSWASQNKAVNHDHVFLSKRGSSIYVNLLDVQIQSQSPNCMGQVTSGFIRLKCRNLLRGSWSQPDGIAESSMGLPWKQLTFKGIWDVEPEEGRMIYLLPIMDQISDWVYGIMIEPSGSTGTHNGWFRRVGYFKLDLTVHHHLPCHWEEQTEYFRSLQKEANRVDSYIPADSIYESTVGEDERGNKLYTIVLI
jgi:hypothetical protein